MQQLDTDLWITDAPLRFFGVEIGARMTIVRLPQGKLLLHSPVSATPDLVREVGTLGSVDYLIAPNRFHHLYVAEWAAACPEARAFLAPGLAEKRPDLASSMQLTDDPDPGWAGSLDQILVEGLPLMNEVVFFHRPSRTLIATDLAFNVGSSFPLATRIAFRMARAYGRLSPTLLERIFAKDRPAFRRSLERILEWPFERVVVSHGEVSETGGREELIRGYAWLLESAA